MFLVLYPNSGKKMIKLPDIVWKALKAHDFGHEHENQLRTFNKRKRRKHINKKQVLIQNVCLVLLL